MKNVGFCLLTGIFSFLLWSCSSNPSALNGGTPIEPDTPKGVQFSYLMHDNDYNAVPQDGNPAEYGTKFRATDGSGMSFELTNTRQYSPGINAELVTIRKGEWYKISFSCFKEAATVPANIKGFLVVSVTRADSFYHYKSYAFSDLLKEQNKNLIGNWTRLTIWHQAPENLQPNDRLQIYHWNPEGGSIFLDDFVVETWTTEPATPAGIALSHGLFEQNYETPELANMTTKEIAARGVASCVLSGAGVQFGAGFKGTLGENQINPGDYIKISFSALKKNKNINYSTTSHMVVELIKNQKDVISWEGTPIDPRLYKNGRQTLGEWGNITVWKQIPADAQPSDILNIYPWNPLPDPVYVDDILIEVWKAGTPVN